MQSSGEDDANCFLNSAPNPKVAPGWIAADADSV